MTYHEMTTLTEVLEILRLRGFDNEFRWSKEGFSVKKGKIYQPEDLTIIKTYRFEGMSDPSDTSILYLIESNDGLTGYSVNAYGAYNSHDDEEGYDNFIRRMPEKGHDEQLSFEL